MKLTCTKHAVKFSVDIRLKTPLMLRSGKAGVYTDSSIEKTQDGDLHINGYVWASLMRRALKRLEGTDVEKMAASVGFYPALEKKSGKTGRILVRPSGTEPVIRVMVEGQDDAVINEMADELCELVRKADRG